MTNQPHFDFADLILIGALIDQLLTDKKVSLNNLDEFQTRDLGFIRSELKDFILGSMEI